MQRTSLITLSCGIALALACAWALDAQAAGKRKPSPGKVAGSKFKALRKLAKRRSTFGKAKAAAKELAEAMEAHGPRPKMEENADYQKVLNANTAAIQKVADAETAKAAALALKDVSTTCGACHKQFKK